MMKIFVAIFGVFALFNVVICRPPALTPSAITRDTRVELPGSERINKRSAEDYVETPAATSSESSASDDEDDEEKDVDYSTEGESAVDKREALESEDFEVAESNIVFHPLFVSEKRSVNKKRSSGSTGGVQEAHKRYSRSSNRAEEESENDMEVAENGMVFLPLFRSRNRFAENQRVRRSAEEVSKTRTSNFIEPDDMEAAENGMVFLPLFRSRNRFTERQRFRRSAEDAKTKTSSDVVETDDLESADDVISRSGSMRRFRPVRSVPGKESLRGGDDNGLQGDDDMDVAENGLIFRPLFRTRQRDTRSVEIGLN